MTEPRDSAVGSNAPQEGTPQQHQQPPNAPQAAAELSVNEGASSSAPDTASTSNVAPGQHGGAEGLAVKPEGSAYASSYRPSDPPASLPPTIGADDAHAHDVEHSDHAPPDQPPPAYTELPGQINDDSGEIGTNAIVADDGRVNIRINQKTRRLSQIFTPQLQQQLSRIAEEPAPPPPYVPEFLGGAPGQDPPPPLNIVIMVVGSRGDVQPFVSLGKVLKETYRHRVRLATHPTFKQFVTENGLEFFSIGGDPAELMAFMVKNPGLMPGFDTLRSGDVGKRRRGIAEMLRGTWRSCIETGDGLGVDPLKHTVEEWMGIEEDVPEALRKPFVADAIIANPPSFGHIHCAEKLGIPLHMMFTMPWSATQQFPHPLANIQASNADQTITNYISYTLVDMLTWQGLGDIINRFRKDSLGLEPISMIWAPGMLDRLKVPYTYCWSPALIPKPKDWGQHISISGFYFLDLAQNYTPAADLAAFLEAGEPPVYIGFGSIVVDDPNAMTKMIFEAVKKTGRRALVSKGWGGLGADELGIPEGVFMLGNCPHDWLFKRVSCVVHHGGAGTTAAGIAAGRPTVVVPFFGDQPFWGAMVARAGAGPMPIAYKDLTADKLADQILTALKPESLDRAKELSEKISQEHGAQKGAQYFHQQLKYDDLRCQAAPNKQAVWRFKRTKVRLSAMAATVLAQEGELNFSELKLFRPREYETDEGPWDPITGGATAIIGTATTMMMGVADFPIETLKLLNIHPDSKGKKSADGSQVSFGSRGGRSRRGRSRKDRPTVNSHASASSTTSTVHGTASPSVPTPTTAVTDAATSAGVTPRHSSSSEINRTASPISPITPGTPTERESFMAQAMRASTQVTRSRSRGSSPCRVQSALSPGRHHGRSRSIGAADLRSEPGSTFSDHLKEINPDVAHRQAKGLGRIIGAGFKSPMEFSLNVAKGFHNVPKLYGGEVRQVDRVTDLQSGVKTGVKELGLGFYEGLTGLVTDPIKGAKKEGGVGFVKGVGRGLAGVPLRVMGGVFSLPGYAMKGLYQEGIKSKGANVQNYIIAARVSQGYDEAQSLTPSQRADIVARWKCIRLNVKKKKNPGEQGVEQLQTLREWHTRKKSEHKALARKFLQEHGRHPSQTSLTNIQSNDSSVSDLPEVVHVNTAGEVTRSLSHDSQGGAPLHHAATYPQPFQHAQPTPEEIAAAAQEAEARELEQAIQLSVSSASQGNQEEDDMLTRAITASINELQRAPTMADEEEHEAAVQRAMKASLEEASRSGATEEEQKALEETLRASLLDTGSKRHHGSDSEWDSDEDTEDDEDYQRIIAESKELAHMRGLLTKDYPTHDPSDPRQFSTAQETGVVGESSSASAGEQGKLPQNDIKHIHEDEEEAQLRAALEASQLSAPPSYSQSQPQGEGTASHSHINDVEEEEALKRALAESEAAEKARLDELAKQKTEEDIVMEYVKKQSLAEEDHRRRMAQGRDVVGEGSGTK